MSHPLFFFQVGNGLNRILAERWLEDEGWTVARLNLIWGEGQCGIDLEGFGELADLVRGECGAGVIAFAAIDDSEGFIEGFRFSTARFESLLLAVEAIGIVNVAEPLAA